MTEVRSPNMRSSYFSSSVPFLPNEDEVRKTKFHRSDRHRRRGGPKVDVGLVYRGRNYGCPETFVVEKTQR